MIKKSNAIIGSFLVVIGILLGIMGTNIYNNIFFQDSIKNDQCKTTNNYSNIESLINIISKNSLYYENDTILLEGALRGMVEALDDPYSTFISEEEVIEFNNELENQKYGIGVSIQMNGNYPIVVHVYEDSPADKMGILVGDTIKTVDGIDIENMTLQEISELIKGEAGVKRSIGVYKDNPQDVSIIELTINLVKIKTVYYDHFLENNHHIGYLKIESFMNDTYDELVEAMTVLEEQGIEGLIIDVRDNPGGLLSSVTNVLDYFLNSDQAFMYSHNGTSEKAYYLGENNHVINYGIVILINERSASAAEVFAKAMQDLGNYDLIGTTTYGKGTMQGYYPIDINTTTMMVKLTTAKWLTSEKLWIQDIGISPTIEVDSPNYRDLLHINPYQVIKYDSVNEDIKDLQIFLKYQGYNIRTDGYFDINTKEALENYQRTKKIAATGEVDFLTAYNINIDIIEYKNNKNHDYQYQKAITYILNKLS